MTGGTHIVLLLVLPAAIGTLCAVLPRKAAAFTRLLALVALTLAAVDAAYVYFGDAGNIALGYQLLHADALARMMCLLASAMALLIMVYNVGVPWRSTATPSYCAQYLWTVAAANAAFLSGNALAFVALWGVLGITLFLLINQARTNGASAAAKKALIIIGGTDSLLIAGIALLCLAQGGSILTMRLAGAASAQDPRVIVGFLCVLAAALAKAGAFPFHTWVPDTAETALVPVTALLPAALDKLLGIYLLVRLVRDMVVPTPALQITVCTLGAITIVAAVFMALVQHDLKRLLGYHAVSQVGYMVLAIGMLTPIGLLAGLFHMVNNVLYKSLLFLGAGAVERRTGTTDLDKLGGLGRCMPVTFVCMLTAALAISGVPPLNGFASKWLIYQGVIELGPRGGLWVVWLAAAMFGSALTLASFVKVLYAVFLARPHEEHGVRDIREVGPITLAPMLVLALLCVVFGVLAWSVPVRGLLARAVGYEAYDMIYMRPVLVTALLVVPLLVGALVYLLSRVQIRRDEAHIGGEDFRAGMALTGTDFYETIENVPGLHTIYGLAKHKWFDVYELGIRLTNYITGLLRAGHQGYLHAYITWCIVALALLIWILSM
jgi:formate hydrogenlyase subunit 3/multisubunit Na+/H+ antiporter MnhD subunit